MDLSDPKQIVRSGYDRVSYAYRPDEPNAQVVRLYAEWLSHLHDRVPVGGAVLDLGCGCGVPGTRLLAERYDVTGVDISPVQIERATRLVPKAKLICGDMAALAFAPASFDAVVSFCALIHVPLAEQPMLLRKIAAWLKPGAAFMGSVGRMAWTGIEEDWLGVKGGTMYWSHQNEETYRRWLAESGLSVEWTRFIPEGTRGHSLVLAHRPVGVEPNIRPTTEADLPDLLRLWNDGRVMRWVGFPSGLGYDLERVRGWYRHLQATPHRHHFVVHAAGIGFCGELFYSVDAAHRRAGLDIKLVPEAQGRGLATAALRALIDRVFESEPQVDAVWTEPIAANAAAQRLYTRCGLKPAPRPPDMNAGASYWERRRVQTISGHGIRLSRRPTQIES
jgi:RimJ/RimL family protein N-acetyltransferase